MNKNVKIAKQLVLVAKQLYGSTKNKRIQHQLQQLFDLDQKNFDLLYALFFYDGPISKELEVVFKTVIEEKYIALDEDFIKQAIKLFQDAQNDIPKIIRDYCLKVNYMPDIQQETPQVAQKMKDYTEKVIKDWRIFVKKIDLTNGVDDAVKNWDF